MRIYKDNASSTGGKIRLFLFLYPLKNNHTTFILHEYEKINWKMFRVMIIFIV